MTSLIERMKVHQRALDAPRGPEIGVKRLWEGLMGLRQLHLEGEGPKLAFRAYLAIVTQCDTGRLDKSTLTYDAERLAGQLGIGLN